MIGGSYECCKYLTDKNSDVIFSGTKVVNTGSLIVMLNLPKAEILFIKQLVNLSGSLFFFSGGFISKR